MGLAEQVIGVKAKKFLMQSMYQFALKYSKIVSNWIETINDIINLTVEQSFDPDERKLEENIAKFLQWLGFSPVDVKWHPDQKIGRFMIGTSRMWQDPRTDDITKVLMFALIGALGKKLLGEKPDVVQISGQLPPRINVGYEIRERYGDVPASISLTEKPSLDQGTNIQTSNIEKSSETSTGKLNASKYKPLINPFIGLEIDKEYAANALMESTIELLNEFYSSDVETFDLSTLHLILFLFQRSAKEDKWKERAIELGDKFALKIKEKYPNATPNDAIEGMGALKPETFEEFLFYGKHQTSEEFCFFLALIFQEYISTFMDRRFVADKPLCATSGSSLCLYAYTREG
ncbi:MAG: hypothetical protein ACFFD1_06135 [Candidatus Thorarchaeota archaeon]